MISHSKPRHIESRQLPREAPGADRAATPDPMTETPAPTPVTTAPEKLGLGEKFSYGLGDLASCLYWQTFMLYLTYFYTDVFGIAALAAGTMIGAQPHHGRLLRPCHGHDRRPHQDPLGQVPAVPRSGCACPWPSSGSSLSRCPTSESTGKLIWAYVTLQRASCSSTRRSTSRTRRLHGGHHAQIPSSAPRSPRSSMSGHSPGAPSSTRRCSRWPRHTAGWGPRPWSGAGS